MRLAVLALALALPVHGQEAAEPPTLKLPAPAKPSIPPPKLTPVVVPPSKWEPALMYSQIALAGAGTGSTVAAQIRQYQNPSTVTAISKVGVVGLAILLQHAYQPQMSNRTKKWVVIGNFAATGVLTGFMLRDVEQTQTTLRTTHK